MALGTITILERGAAQGPIFLDRVSIVGDASYPTGGSAGVEAALQAVIGSGRTVLGIQQEYDGTPNAVEYDHANDKLFVRVKATGVERSAADDSGNTYKALVLSK